MSKNKRMKIKSMFLIALIIMIGTQILAYGDTPVPIGTTVQSVPFESNPTAHASSGIPPPSSPTNAYDRNLDSFAYFTYAGVTGWFELKTYTNPPSSGKFEIGWVDFKISYRAAASVDDEYRIVYYVDNAGPVVLQDWVGGPAAQFRPDQVKQAHRAWGIQPEPNDGAWNWTDIAKVRIRFETRVIGGPDAPKSIFLYEVWLTVYPDPLPPDGVSVQPSAILDLHGGDIFFVDIYVVGVEDLWGFEFRLDYDTSILTALDIAVGHEYFGYHPLNDVFQSVIDDGAGYVSLVLTSYFGDSVGFTGNTPMVRIYFSVDADGTSLLHLSNSILSNIYGSIIVKPVADGVFATSAVRDVAVMDVQVSPTQVTSGENVTVDVNVMNQGTIPETFYVTVYYDSKAIGPAQTVRSLTDGANQTISFNWNTTGVTRGTYTISAKASVLYGETDTSDNTFTDGTVSVLGRDVAVTDVQASPTTVWPGQNVIINATVQNQGDFPETFNVTAKYDLNIIENKTVVNLAAGANQNLTFTWNTLGVALGNYIINAEASVVPGETDTSDNTFTDGTVSVLGRDVAVTDVQASPTTVLPGESITVNATVQNQGDFPETFNVTTKYNNTIIETKTVTNLGVGAFTTISFTWNTAGVAAGEYFIKAEASVVPGETDTSDNTFTDGTVTLTLEPTISITPTSGSIGTTIQVTGRRFKATQHVVLSFDDMPIAEIYTSDRGNFTAVFSVPPSEAGVHLVKAWSGTLFVNATFTVIDVTPIDINSEVGQTHFRGELVEFYIQTVVKGTAADVTSLNATLYKPDGTNQKLTTIQHVATGLYKVPYGAIPLSAPVGAYVLVVDAKYRTDIIDSKGTSIESFLVSSTLTSWDALIISINKTVVLIKTDVGLIEVKLDTIKDIQLVRIENRIVTINSTLGVIRTNLDTIEAKLISIEGTAVTINSTVGLIRTDLGTLNTKISIVNGTLVTIRTDLGTISGKLDTINGDIATIKTDIGTIKTTLEGWTGETITSIITPNGTFNLLALTTSPTLQSLTFSDNIITAVVSGPTDTSGTTNFVLPKQFLEGIGSTIEQIAATVNDREVDYEIWEIKDTYVVSLSYSHSTQTMKIFLLGMPPQPPLPIATILMIILVIAIAIGAVALYLKRMRKKPTNP